MSTSITLLAVLAGYLLGAISFARIIGNQVVPGEDLQLTQVDVGGTDKKYELVSVSATSISMRAGLKLGCLTSLLDMLKVTLPVMLFRLVYPEADYYLMTAAAGVAGHNFPPYYKFKGGLGLSPLFGGLLVIDWLAIPVTAVLSGFLGLFIFRNVVVVYGGSPFLLIPWMWLRFQDFSHLFYALIVNILFGVAAIPSFKNYRVMKRTGEFDQSALFETGYMAYVTHFLRKRGWMKQRNTVSHEKLHEKI